MIQLLEKTLKNKKRKMKMIKKRRKELKASGNFLHLLKTFKDNSIYIIVCSTQPWGMSNMLKH